MCEGGGRLGKGEGWGGGGGREKGRGPKTGGQGNNVITRLVLELEESEMGRS